MISHIAYPLLLDGSCCGVNCPLKAAIVTNLYVLSVQYIVGQTQHRSLENSVLFHQPVNKKFQNLSEVIKVVPMLN
jgi:hypothetical protein